MTLPGYSECIIQGGAKTLNEINALAMFEPIFFNEDEEDKYDGIIFGRSLMDLKRKDIGLPIRVLNTTSDELKLRAGMKIGYLHKVDAVQEIEDAENSEIEQICRTYSICNLHAVDIKTSDTDFSANMSSKQNWCEDLQKLYNRSVQGLSNKHEDLATGLVDKHSNKFVQSSEDYGRTKVVQYGMDTGDAKPVRSRARRPPKAFEKEEDEIIDRQLKAGIITESTSPWASPLVFVRKRDGTTRACVDYRRVNELMKPCTAWELPKIGDCLDCLHGAKLFSTLDLQAGYWQIEVKPEDRPKTAFISSKRGLFEYVTMPFGLCNAPSTFQRCMELVMKGLQWKTLLIYLDDLIVFSSTFEEHITRLDEVLTRLGEAGLKLKPSKCELFQESVIFLGYLVTPDGVKPDPQKVEAVHDWPTPKNVTGVRAFLGLCSYYRRFIKGFAHIAGPLNSLLEAGQAFEWSEECQAAFDALKAKLTGEEVMAYPADDGLFILDTDASNTGIGATLSQVQWCEQSQQNEERPIAYASQSMTKTQRRYCTTRRELLAIVRFVWKFRYYLLGRQFLIRTDHSALRWVMSFKEPSEQMARWLEILSQFHFKLEHRAGKKHTNADALSRRNCIPDECDCYDRDSILSELPCGGCKYCIKKHEMWSDFFEVDDVVPLAVRQIKGGMAKSDFITSTCDCIPSVIVIVRIIMLVALTFAVVFSLLSRTNEEMRTCLQFTYWAVLASFQTLRSERNNGATPLLHEKLPRVYAISKVNPTVSGMSANNETESTNSTEQTGHLKSPSSRSEDTVTASWIDGYTADEIAKLQHDDPNLCKIIDWLRESPTRPDRDTVELRHESPCTRNLHLLWKQLVLRDGVLYKKWETNDKMRSHLQVVVPRSLKNTVMFAMHNSVTSGHLGFKKTYQKIQRRFYWYNLKEDVRNWIKKCVKCGARKRPAHTPKAPLSDIRVGAPMDRLDTDILGPLPTSDSGMKYILLVQDQFTKWTECYAIPDQTAETVAHKIVFEFIARFGTPLTIHSDQGSNYESHLFKQICSLLEVNKVHCTPFHPQANGGVEVFNKTILNMISMYVDKNQHDWDKYLPLLTSAYRSCEHAATGYSPNMMFLGRETYQPIEVLFGEPYIGYATDVKGEICDYVIDLRERMTNIYELVRNHLQQQCTRQRKESDTSSGFYQYNSGDLVYVRDSNKTKGLSPKLQAKWQGPGVIIRKFNDLVFEVRINQKGKSKTLHHDRLKPYTSDEVPNWMKRLTNKLQSSTPTIHLVNK